MRTSVPEGYDTLIPRPLEQDNRLIKDVDALRLALWQIASKVNRIPLIAPIKKRRSIALLLNSSLKWLSVSCCGMYRLLGLPDLFDVLKPFMNTEAAVLDKLIVYRPVLYSAHSIHVCARARCLHVRPVERSSSPQLALVILID